MALPAPHIEPLRLTIELDPAAQPITGRVQEGGRPAVEFCGWLELLSAVDTRIDAAARGDR